MKRIMLILGTLLIVGGGIVSANQAAHPGRGGTGPGFGPPPEAFTACEGKSEGDAAQFIAPGGKTVTGTCRTADKRLVLRPDHPKARRAGPPPEAYKACTGKAAGDTATFTNPRGYTVTGTCMEQDGKLVLRPDRRN